MADVEAKKRQLAKLQELEQLQAQLAQTDSAQNAEQFAGTVPLRIRSSPIPFTPKLNVADFQVPRSVEAGVLSAGKTATNLIEGTKGRLQAILGPDTLAGVGQRGRARNEQFAPVDREFPRATLAGAVAPGFAVPGMTAPNALKVIGMGMGMGVADAGVDPLAGAVAGGAGAGLAHGASQVLQRIIAPSGVKLATAAINEAIAAARRLGVPITAAKATGSKIANIIEAGARSNPISGGAFEAIDERGRIAMNRAALNEIGEAGDEITEDIFERAAKRIGDVYNRVVGNRTVQAGQQFTDDLDAIATDNLEFIGELLPQGRSAIDAARRVFIDQAGNPRAVTGQQGWQAASQFRKLARSTDDAVLSDVYTSISDAIREAVTESAPAAEKAALRVANKQYRNLMLLERRGVVDTAKGNISPRTLSSAMQTVDKAQFKRGTNNRGALNDIAKVGKAFADDFGNSGTAQRLLGAAALGTGGYVANDVANGEFDSLGTALGAGAGLLLGGHLAASPGAQAYLRNQLTPRLAALLNQGAGRIGTQAAVRREEQR